MWTRVTLRNTFKGAHDRAARGHDPRSIEVTLRQVLVFYPKSLHLHTTEARQPRFGAQQPRALRNGSRRGPGRVRQQRRVAAAAVGVPATLMIRHDASVCGPSRCRSVRKYRGAAHGAAAGPRDESESAGASSWR
jgi:hypothetical protein